MTPGAGLGVAIALHALAAVIWVGGMFFAFMALRPAAMALEPPHRLALWGAVFRRFFPWVWAAVVVLLVTGYGMIFGYYGGMSGSGWHIHLMHGIGIVMMLLFAHLYFAPHRRLQLAIASQDWPGAAGHLNLIRQIIGINLILGLVTVAVAAGGRYL